MVTARSFAALLLLALVASAQEQLDPAVERFRDLAAKEGGDREALRREIAAFVREKIGSTASTQAAAVLSRLPSPLDQLDPENIPELERFAWQPKELVAVLGEHRGRQGAVASCVVWTPDGKRVISGGGQGYVRIWDATTLRQEARVSTSGATTCLSVSRDSKTLAAGSAGGWLHVWDISAKTPVSTGVFRIGTSRVYSVDISSDGKLLAAGVFDTLIHTFDLDGSKPKEKTQLSGCKAAVTVVSFTPDSRVLAGACSDGAIRFWGFPGGDKINELGPLQVHTGSISCLTQAARGGTMMAGCADGNVVRVSMGAKFTKGTSFKTPSAVTDISYSPAGYLTTSHSDGDVRVWAGGTPPKPSITIEGHFGSVNGFAWSPDGRGMATAGSDWTVRLWSTAGTKGVEKFPLRGHWMGSHVNVFSTDATQLATGSSDRTARVWDVAKATPAQYAQFPPTQSLYKKGEASALSSLAFTPDGKSLATGGTGATVKLWNIKDRMHLRNFTAPSNGVGQLTFTPDGQSLYGVGQMMIFGWNTATAKEAMQAAVAERYLNGLALSPDARFALAGTGYYVYEKGKPLIKDGKYVYQDISLRLFDLRQGRLVQERKDLPTPVGPVSYLPDRRVALTLWSNAPALWDVSNSELKETRSLKGLTALGNPAVFSPDAKRVLMDSAPVRLVDLEKETTLKTFAFDEQVYSYRFSPDGRYMALSLVTGPVYVLRLGDPPAASNK